MGLPLEVATYLAGAGLGLQLGVSIFDVPFPEGAQDNAAYIETYPGREGDRTFGGNLAAPLGDWTSFTVFVRDARENVAVAETLAIAIHKKLRNIQGQTLSGVLYRDIRATAGAPYFAGFDHSNNRPLYACHYEADKNES